MGAQGEIERPPPQGEQHPRPGCDTINDTIVTDQTQLEVQQIDKFSRALRNRTFWGAVKDERGMLLCITLPASDIVQF
jgi:hypothetical protein